jgi:hypothetical protein
MGCSSISNSSSDSSSTCTSSLQHQQAANAAIACARVLIGNLLRYMPLATKKAASRTPQSAHLRIGVKVLGTATLAYRKHRGVLQG